MALSRFGMILLAFFFAVCLLGSLCTASSGAELSGEELTLLNKVFLEEYPEVLDIDASMLRSYLERARRVEGGRVSSFYEPLPAKSERQHGRCDEVFVATKGEQFRWIQGQVNLTSGATTFFLHFSYSCDGCIDVLKKANEMYQGLRSRGLNVVGIYSNPVGYLPSTEEDRELRELLREHKIAFPVVSLGSKRGPPPLLRNGLVDVKRAKKSPTAPESLYRWLYGDLGFVVPIAVIYKNCLALQENPSVGYTIMALKGSVEKSRDDLLWPPGALRDSQEQEERFHNTLLEFGIGEQELGLPLTEEEAKAGSRSPEDEDEDEEDNDDFGSEERLQRRGSRGRGRRTRTRTRTPGRGSRSRDEDDEDEDEDEL